MRGAWGGTPFGIDSSEWIRTPLPVGADPDDCDAAINAVAVQATMRWTGTHFAHERKIVFGGEVRAHDRTALDYFLLGRIPYAAGCQYPDLLGVFATDPDRDGIANDGNPGRTATPHRPNAHCGQPPITTSSIAQFGSSRCVKRSCPMRKRRRTVWPA